MNIDTNSNVTFVSAYIDVYTSYSNARIKRMELFRILAETGINICLYISTGDAPRICEMAASYPNVKIMGIVTLDSLFALQLSKKGVTLPANRSESKDTLEYMSLMNEKTEYMRAAILANPFNSTHFAWVDFGLAHVFKDVARSQDRLRHLSTAPLIESFLAIPGCYKMSADTSTEEMLYKNIFNNVNWRFCGGFFIGDAASIIRFADMHRETVTHMIETYGLMTWEVNVWAWIESKTTTLPVSERWSPGWFAADHDDRMVEIPAKFFAFALIPKAVRVVEYNYPNIEPGFYAGSAALVEMQDGRKILNTRYVNYMQTDTGSYIFSDENNTITTKNIMCELDDNWKPIEFNEMSNPDETVFPAKQCVYMGLEDIRLFERPDKNIGCIACSLCYSPVFQTRMVTGVYDTTARCIRDCAVIAPPAEGMQRWEKNWAVLPGGERVVYSWNPMEIGRITNDNILKIEYRYNIKSSLFYNMRGSTTFTPMETNLSELIGLVHFSEGHSPREYYHMLVVLDSVTYKPLRRSETFYFEHIGIEFCIGMSFRDQIYRFWISRFDRAPAMIEIAEMHLPLNIELTVEIL